MAAIDSEIARLREARMQLAADARGLPAAPMQMEELPAPPMPRSAGSAVGTVWGGMISGAKTITKVAFVAVVGIAAIGFLSGALGVPGLFPQTLGPVFTGLEHLGSNYLIPFVNQAGVFITQAASAITGLFSGIGTSAVAATSGISGTTVAATGAAAATGVVALKAVTAKTAAAETAMNMPASDTANTMPLYDVPGDEMLLPAEQITAKKFAASQHGHAVHHGHHGHHEAAMLKKTAAHIGSDHAVEHLDKRDEQRRSFADRVGQRTSVQGNWAEYADASRTNGPLTRT